MADESVRIGVVHIKLTHHYQHHFIIQPKNDSTMRSTNIIILAFAVISSSAFAGPVAWGICQSACNAGYVVCCAGAGGLAGQSLSLSVDHADVQRLSVLVSAFRLPWSLAQVYKVLAWWLALPCSLPRPREVGSKSRAE
jgi:hypothetical protein